MTETHDRDDPRRPDLPPTDEVVLAAIERAARHRARETPAVPIWAITEHLGLSRRSSRGRAVRAQLERMAAAGELLRARHRGVPTWALTSGGRRRLAAALLTDPQPLPESPQHQTWRRARTAAGCEIERFRDTLRRDLEEATGLLDASGRPHSDSWLEMGERLHRDARRLASAVHCLFEWPEPHDERADIDDRNEPGDVLLDARERERARARRMGRRNVRLWQ